MYQPNVFGFSERKWNSLRCKEHKSTCFVATESFGYRISKPVSNMKMEINTEFNIQSQLKIAA